MPKLSRTMDALQCGPPDAAGDAAALLAATIVRDNFGMANSGPYGGTQRVPARSVLNPHTHALLPLTDGCQSPWNAKPPIPQAILPLLGHHVSPLSQKTTDSNEKCHRVARTSQTSKLPYIREKGRKRASGASCLPQNRPDPTSVPATVPVPPPVALQPEHAGLATRVWP